MDPAQNNPNSESNSSQPNQTWTPPPPDWSVPPVNFYPEETQTPQPPVVPPAPAPVPAPVTQVLTQPVVSTNPTPAIGQGPAPSNISVPQTQRVSPPKKSGGGGRKFLIIALLLIIIGCLGATVFSLLQNKFLYTPTSTTQNEQEVLPSATSSAQMPVLTTSNHELLYIKSSNIYNYSLANNKETQLTNDGSGLVQYRLPKFAGPNLVSFIRCDHKSIDNKQPYSCSLVKQQLNGSTPIEIARLDSKANSNGAYVGAQIQTYAWDKNATQAAYLAQGFDANNNVITNLYITGSASGSAIKLDTFTDTAGRGGSLDDTVSLAFSPSGTKLLLDYTFLYPASGSNDRGTMFVYDLATKKLVWSVPKNWISFAHWMSDTQIIAKSQLLAENLNGPQNLVKIDITKPSADIAAFTTIVTSPNWFEIEPMTASISSSLVFWSMESSMSAGIALEQLDLATKIKKTITKNTLHELLLDKSSLLVYTMKSCGNDCGMDAYNGFIVDGVGVYQLDTNNLQLIPIASGSAHPTDFASD